MIRMALQFVDIIKIVENQTPGVEGLGIFDFGSVSILSDQSVRLQ